MKNKRSIMALLLTAIMLIYCIPTIDAEENKITISSSKDFVNFAKKCTLDTYSVGKTVNLTCDIDLSDTDFAPVPTFGGTFSGNGHTISGIKFTKNGSKSGLFRYIQYCGKVTGLTVKGDFLPSGTKSFIGGIAGENNGLIENCTFDGKIAGDNVIGGIAGKNGSSGKIVSCQTYGSVIGENSSGGIAGKNDGFISNCTNDAQVNTVFEEKKLDIKDIDVDTGAIVETYKTKREENEEDSILGHTDSGGIAGYNSGVLQGCRNNAAVGYPHVGYNIGGIVGRQSGYILGCENYGTVKGRKDVGGIVGQMEPYILLDVSEISLKSLRDELSTLNRMVNRFVSDADSLDSDVEEHLDKISEQSETARNSTETLLNEGTAFVNDNVDEINTETAIISNALDKLDTVFKNLSDSSSDMADAIDSLNELLDSYAEDDENLSAINTALGNMSTAEQQLDKASDRARRGASALDDALIIYDVDAVSAATSDLTKAIKDIVAAKSSINDALGDIEQILNSNPDSIAAIGGNVETIKAAISNIRKSTQGSISALKTVSDSLGTIFSNTEIDINSFKEGMHNLESAIVYITDAMGTISRALSSISSISSWDNDFSETLTSMSDAAVEITEAMEDMSEIISDLSDESDLNFVKLSDEFKTANDDLFDSLSNISDEITKLRSSASKGKTSIVNDANHLNDQFNVVMNLLIDEMEELQSVDDLSDIFLDVSDEDIEHTKQGKVAECANFGKVEADRNTGGIAGSMAIEYAKDPENEYEKPTSLNFTYRTKAVLQECVNDGAITGKKDCSGGIVGLSEIGIVYKCENYGNAESTGGNYVGGIVGKSESGIRKCYSKCRLSGNNYVGGISGKAINMNSCYSIVSVSGDESIGAVCGTCDAPEKLSQNFYLDKGVGAIDGISYSKTAEPLAFEGFCSISEMPERMTYFAVTFFADDDIVDTQKFTYGEEISQIKYPEIPKRDGYFGVWQPVEADTISEDIDIFCEYSPYITVIASEEKNKSGKLAIALAEGEFTDKARLNISESKEKPRKSGIAESKAYDITLSGTDLTDSDTVKLHILNEKQEYVAAWRLVDGKWERLATTKRGKYVILNMTGTSETICLQYKNTSRIFLWIVIILILIAVAFLIIWKKRTAKKA